MRNHEFANLGIRPPFPALNSAEWAWGRAGPRLWLYGRETDGEPLFVVASQRGKDWVSCSRGFLPGNYEEVFRSFVCDLLPRTKAKTRERACGIASRREFSRSCSRARACDASEAPWLRFGAGEGRRTCSAHVRLWQSVPKHYRRLRARQDYFAEDSSRAHVRYPLDKVLPKKGVLLVGALPHSGSPKT